MALIEPHGRTARAWQPAAAPIFLALHRLWAGPRSLAGRRALFAILTAAALAVLVIVFLNDPAAAGKRFPPCWFYAVTGWYCPGCGSTRGVHQLLHGHLAAAFRMNPFMVLCTPYLAYAYLTYAARVAFPRAHWHSSARAPTKAQWIWSLLALILLYWALRNVPAYPFNLLAPH